MPRFRLISFKICPFVQRSVIVLKEKKIPFAVEYIDLANKPDWFLKLSPTGKVPVLETEGEVLFESAIIMEYLDEVTPPTLHSAAPLTKAKDRAWIEFSSALLVLQYQMSLAKTAEDYGAKLAALRDGMHKFAAAFQGPWWRGEAFSLVDAAIAPLFTRIGYTEQQLPDDVLADLDILRRYQKALEARASIRDSVLPEVPQAYREYIRQHGGYMAQWL